MKIIEVKKILLTNALKEFNGNRTKAAKKLGISIRGIRLLINQFDLKQMFPTKDPRKNILNEKKGTYYNENNRT